MLRINYVLKKPDEIVPWGGEKKLFIGLAKML